MTKAEIAAARRALDAEKAEDEIAAEPDEATRRKNASTLMSEETGQTLLAETRKLNARLDKGVGTAEDKAKNFLDRFRKTRAEK